MKKAISVLAMALAAAMHLIADIETVDGITWTYERYDDEVWLGEWVDDDYDGHYITAIDTSLAAERLVIPSTLGGLPVTEINERAFKNCSGIESVVIPEGVVEIDERAFYGCSCLTNVSIPKSMEYLDSKAFQGTPLCASSSIYVVVDGWAVRSTYIPSIPSEVVFDGIRGVAGGLFEDYEDIANLKKITFATSLPCIGVRAFSWCEGLEEVVLPEGLERIGNWAFSNCDSLTKINIPTSVVEIGKYAFVGCNSLDDIAISNENVTIGDYAFSSCTNLKNVTLPESLRGKVSASVFQNCHPDLDLSEYIVLEPLYSSSDDSCRVWGMSWVGNLRGSLHIPSEHDGLPVVDISNGAFANQSNIVSIVIDNGVTNIGAFAFQNCRGLRSIVIPDSVINIDSWAFSGCSALTNVVFGNSLRRIGTDAFEDCTALQEAILPDGLLELESYCFKGCRGLRKIDVPGSIANFGIIPFLGCTGLTEVVLRDGIGNIGFQWFEGCTNLVDVTMPNTVTNIESYAFSGCGKLESISIPAGVANIGYGAFSACSNLVDATIPSAVTNIEAHAFYGCAKLERISIPAGVARIGYAAFSYCNGLKGFDIAPDNPYYAFDAGGIYSKDKSLLHCWVGDPVEVTIPATVTSMGSYPFHGCPNLASIHVEDGNSKYSSFEGVLYNKAMTSIVAIPEGLSRVVLPDTMTDIWMGTFSGMKATFESVVIPSSVTNISDSAFSYCPNLKEVILPEGITEIPDWCFYSCSNLVSVTIPSSVRRIGLGAFMYCTSLEEIAIPDGVEFIDRQAFMGCSSLKKVALPPGLTEISVNTFSGCVSIESIVIPSGVLDIGGSAFYGCSSLATASIMGPVTNIAQSAFRDTGLIEIALPTSLESIGGHAFAGCEKLAYVEMPEHLVGNLPQSVFNGCTSLDVSQFVARTWNYIVLNDYEAAISYTEPRSGRIVVPSTIDGYRVTQIQGSTFSGGDFTEVVIPNIYSIGTYTFSGCKKLKKVTFSGGCKNIADYAFNNCEALEALEWPDNLAAIGRWAFKGCVALEVLELPDSLEEIGQEAFVGCESISQIKIPQSVTSIGNWAFEGCSNATLTVNRHLIELVGTASLSSYFRDVRALEFTSDVRSLANTRFYLYNITELTLPESITELHSSIFSNCTNLESVAILGPVETIPTDAFINCKKLREISLPTGLTQIGLGAFAHCASLAEIEMPDTLWGIGRVAFEDCTSLSVLKTHGDFNVEYGAFANCTNLTTLVAFDGDPYQLLWSLGTVTNVFCMFEYYDAVESSRQDVNLRYVEYYGHDAQVTNIDGVVWSYVTIDGGAVICSGKKEAAVENASGDIVIPDTLGGCPVVEIGIAAFMDETAITSVVIPSTVTNIAHRAFEGCIGLVAVGLPASLRSIGDFAFKGCLNIRTLTLPNEDIHVGKDAFLFREPVNISGTIAGDTVLDSQTIYIITNDLIVPRGKVLTIPRGTVLKFAEGVALRVRGKLVVEGSLFAPVIFTSIKDDAHGGDTNGDGDGSVAYPGDWGGVIANGARIEVEYAQFLFGGGVNGNSYGARASCFMWDSSSGVFSCCRFSGSPMDGCFAQNATFSNCIFDDNDRGLVSHTGTITANNCVAANNRIGFFSHTSPLVVRNSISSLNTETAITGDGGSRETSSCYLGDDPKFLDPTNGDYRIAADSPCVDAGDAAYAPEKDYYGSPRYAMTYGGEAKPDIGIYEVLPKRVASEVDLEAVEISVSGDSFSVGDSVTIKWKVRNAGSATAQGPWTDTISAIDASGAVVALGTVATSATLAPGASVDCEATFRIPSIAEGAARLRLTVNSGRDVFEGTLTANNTISSVEAFTVALPVIDLGAGTLLLIPSGSSVAFSLPASSGATVLLVSGSANISVYGASGYVPRHNHNDVEAVRLEGGLLAGMLMLAIPKDATSNGFVVSIANDGTTAESVTIATETRTLAIAKVSPSRLVVGASGSLLIRGIGMVNVTSVRLEGAGGSRLVATEITRLSVSEIMAMVATSATTPTGTYSVTVEDAEGHTDRLNNAFQIYKPIEGPKLEAHLELPSAVRRGRITTGRIVYSNTGDQPMRAPYFMISADNAQFRMDGEEEWQQGYIEVMGLGDGVKPGTLEPGERGAVTFEFVSLGGIEFRLESDNDSSAYWAEYADAAASAANRVNQRGRRVVRYTELERHADEFRNHPETANAACGVLCDRASGEPLAGVEVCAMSADGELLSSDTVDANGVFVLEGLPNATNLVLSVIDGAFADDMPVAMPASGDLLGLKWYGTKGWTIYVFVNGATDEDFAEGIGIDIVRLGDDSTTTHLTLTNAVEGVASATVRESGIYIIRGRTNGGGEQFALVECEAGATVAEAVVDFAAGHSISGVVADLDGNGLSGALLSLSPKGEMNGYSRTVTSDENGAWTFGCIEDGEYLLSWTKNGYGSDVAVDVSVNGGNVTDLSLRCMAFAQSISGKVNVECAGMTAAFATSAGGSVTATIADDGTFTLEGLPEGRGTFSVMDGSGNIIYMMRDLYVRPGANTLDVTAETELCDIVGVTVDANGNPVQAVWLFTSTSGDGGAGYANENGKCLTKLRKATYDVSIAADGFVTRKFRRKITDSCKLTATLERGGCAKVAADADACLVAFSADGIVDDGVEASDDGTVSGAYTNGTEVTAFVVCLDKAYRTDSIAIAAGTTGTLSRVDGGRALTITAIGNKTDVAAFRLALADGSGFVATWPIADGKLELVEFPAVAAVVSAIAPDGSIISSADVAANVTIVDVATSTTLPIAGYIVDDTPTMLAGGAVSFGKEGGKILATAEVTPFGTFRADYVSDEYERVWVQLPNGLVFSVSRVEAEAANFSITPPDLDDTGLSQLKVVDENGEPVEGAEIDVETADGYETTLTTDRRGIITLVTVVYEEPPKYGKPKTPSDPPKKPPEVKPENPTPESETKKPMERETDNTWMCQTCKSYPCKCKVDEGGDDAKKDMQNRCPSCGQIEPCSCKDKGDKTEKKEDNDNNNKNPIEEEPVTEPELEELLKELTEDDIPDLDLPTGWEKGWDDKYQSKIRELILRYEKLYKDTDPLYETCRVRNCYRNKVVWQNYRNKKFQASRVYDLTLNLESVEHYSHIVEAARQEIIPIFGVAGTVNKIYYKRRYNLGDNSVWKDAAFAILGSILVEFGGQTISKAVLKALQKRLLQHYKSWVHLFTVTPGVDTIKAWQIVNKNYALKRLMYKRTIESIENVGQEIYGIIDALDDYSKSLEEFEDKLQLLHAGVRDAELRIANAERAASIPYHKCGCGCGSECPCGGFCEFCTCDGGGGGGNGGPHPSPRDPIPPYPYTPPEPKSQDPNEVVGPLGVGEARYVKAGDEMLYTVYFENKSDASAAAQDIYITNPLSEWLDWTTFEMGDVGFCNQSDHNLNGLKSGVSEVAQKGTSYYVQSSVALDESAGRVKIELHIIDKTTKYGVPEDPYAGILPPNDDTHRGEGYITYRIKLREDAPGGVMVNNSATIVFDYNDPIVTDPAWWNTVAEMAGVTMTVDGVATNLDLIVGMPYGELPEPTAKVGYVFGGWWTGPNGSGRRVRAQDVVQSGDSALYEHWLANAYTVRFNANGGDGVMSSQAFEFDEEKALDACALTKVGHSFAGWATNVVGEVVYADCQEVVNLASEDGAAVDLYAVWRINSYSITFDYGYDGRKDTATQEYGTAIVVPDGVDREGYTFLGWRPAVPSTVPAMDVVFVAQWEEDSVPPPVAETWVVMLDANGGSLKSSPRKVVKGGEVMGHLPIPTLDGYEFVRWFTAVDGGDEVGAQTVVTANMTIYAQWKALPPRLWNEDDGSMEEGGEATGDDDAHPPMGAASVYDGFIGTADGELRGTIQVKVAKPKANKKTGETTAKVTASILLTGEKKVSVKGEMNAAAGELSSVAKDGRTLSLILTAERMSGSFGGFLVDGSRNAFVSKDKGEQADANAALAQWIGPVNVAWPGNGGWNGMTVTIANKGKAKVAGTLADGTKLSGTAQVVQGSEWSAVPVVITKKAELALTLWLSNEGQGSGTKGQGGVVVTGLGDDVVAGKPGTLASGSEFVMDVDAFSAMVGDDTFAEYLPNGVAVTQNGAKWSVPKGGKVAYKKGTAEVDEAKAGENPAVLKLTYTAKTGAFKGSFKAYVNAGGKPKSLAAKIVGVMVRGIAYGAATIKKIGGIGIVISDE